MFENRQGIAWPADQPPLLMVVVDTEEEFDWQAGPNPKATGVTAMAGIGVVQSICHDYGLKPCYVVDYPVASQHAGYRQLKDWLAKGVCEVGAHLHAWVTPPLRETVNLANSYPGNLPEDLEREKLARLTDIIERNLGARPVAYKAGRYGFGPNTAGILAGLGYQVDLSLCPPLDSSADGGPDYTDENAWPFWFGADGARLLELPCTGGFVGHAGDYAPGLYRAGQRYKGLHAPGVLARTGLVDRLMLSPEGFSHKEHIKLVRSLYRQGLRVFTWSFHSPSVVPGHTPYVQTKEQLDEFLDSFRAFFDFFLNDLGGQPTTPGQLPGYLKERTL
ncbi:MAG: WalW protein [Alteromonadaceae bacterium]|nr:WalW protein [Alteromonadaceae bacterium]